ncbi:putative bifunctional diguanylate cyclase/phosphodiesterase [Blastococcus sp. SYSU D00695]
MSRTRRGVKDGGPRTDPGDMALLRRLVPRSLLARFAVLGAVLTVGLGVVLYGAHSAAISERAREQAERTVVVTVRLGLQPLMTAVDLTEGIDPELLAHVADTVRSSARDRGGDGLAALDPVELKVYDRTGRVVFADDGALVGTRSTSDELQEALAGEVVSEFSSDTTDDDASHGGDRRLLEVYVPLQFDGSATPDGAVEVYLPYAPVATAISEDLRTLTVLLVGSLAVFYAALFRVIASASKRLRRQTTALQESAERERHRATHDALTGLPNRVLLRDRLTRALADAAGTRGEVAVLHVDLDRFQEVNDTLGHSWGDRLLLAVGPRIASVLRDGDTVARLGGDEFAVLLPAVDGVPEAQAVAARVRAALHRPFDLGDGVGLDIEVSIGIAVSPAHGSDAEGLQRAADIAVHAAKELTSGVVVFDPDRHVAPSSRLTVLGDLRRALERTDELTVHYQPKVSLADGRLEGAEALVRWRHPERGLVPPADFVPVAEGTGLIVALTERVLDLSLAQMRRWADAGRPLPVAVNLSTRCLLDASVPDLVARLLAEHGVPASLLRLEVTESAVLADAERGLQVLQRLRAMGVHLSIDDFGTGYSSMALLRRLPVDELKIDRSFVLGMTVSEQDAVLVRTAVDLAHNLGLTVVAEGVEEPGHVTALRALRCDVAQGYLFARPMPAEDLDALLELPGPVPGAAPRQYA